MFNQQNTRYLAQQNKHAIRKGNFQEGLTSKYELVSLETESITKMFGFSSKLQQVYGEFTSKAGAATHNTGEVLNNPIEHFNNQVI